MRRLFIAAVAILHILPARSEVRYTDDRSDPTALLESLYNAINRREYARAWSYFARKPAPDLQTYAEGYADTEAVTVKVGLPSGHQAPDGTVHHYVPVAIEATNNDGEGYVYGGCYELKLSPQQVGGEAFSPLQIVEGKLSSSSGTLADALPKTCDDLGEPDPRLLPESRAKALFAKSFGATCDPTLFEAGDEQAFRSWLVTFKYPDASPDDPVAQRRIFQFLCNRGAYNESHIFMMADADGEDLKTLSFAVPDLDIDYADDESARVQSIAVKGFGSQIEVANADFDPDSLTILSFAKWRGLGDASSVATWVLRDGEFALLRYDVDASYDGEHDSQTVVDYGKVQ
ncbi:DUF1176 domain-containing protein [Tianweitania sediminis]|uniref:DUF1176 domain-containing protein n=1 Tax=Tianweitania sediminis TaxID=1502156 RepID=A0A8J7QWU2_9HYPH|nr:DUF1176 domain-containing protein [Tianweitania sediminis]MBP0437045.1 DUF1176 domain-containing protein [Tianweitania sediminis]